MLRLAHRLRCDWKHDQVAKEFKVDRRGQNVLQRDCTRHEQMRVSSNEARENATESPLTVDGVRQQASFRRCIVG